MKLLVLACLVTLVAGGTRKAEPGEEARAVALWQKHCENGGEGGKEGNIYIHCKHPLAPETRILPVTDLQGEAEAEQREQYIFVQPAPIHFNHNLRVKTDGGLEPKTIVYVKPAKTSHTYESDFDTSSVPHTKPELVFLGAEGSGAAEGVKATTTTKRPSRRSGGHGQLDKVIQ